MAKRITTTEVFDSLPAKSVKKNDYISIGRRSVRVLSNSKNSYGERIIEFRTEGWSSGSRRMDGRVIIAKNFPFRVTRSHTVTEK